jgi:hypothetical protein
MKKETLIRLVVGLGDVCLAIALFMVGICFDWFVMLFPGRDCPCDHYANLWTDVLFLPLVIFNLQWVIVLPLLLIMGLVCPRWKWIFGNLAVVMMLIALFLQLLGFLKWHDIIFIGFDSWSWLMYASMLTKYGIIASVVFISVIWLFGMFVCIKLFFKHSNSSRK